MRIHLRFDYIHAKSLHFVTCALDKTALTLSLSLSNNNNNITKWKKFIKWQNDATTKLDRCLSCKPLAIVVPFSCSGYHIKAEIKVIKTNIVQVTFLIWNSSNKRFALAQRYTEQHKIGGKSCGAMNWIELSGNKPIALIIKHHKLWANAILAGRQINYIENDSLAFSCCFNDFHLFSRFVCYFANNFQSRNARMVYINGTNSTTIATA